MCLWNPGTDDEQMEVRHADASGGDITGNQHEEKRMRDILSGAAGEEQLDKLRKTVQSEQCAPSAAASSEPPVALEYLASGETHDRLEQVLFAQRGWHLFLFC